MTAPGFDLNGRVAIVAGGAGAIGSVVANALAECGVRVAILDLERAHAEEAAEALNGEARGWPIDLRDVASFPTAIETVEQAFGPVDILVNTGGYLIRNYDLFSITEAEWDQQHGVNLKATFFMCQAVARSMAEKKRPGSLINYTSQGWMSGGYNGSVVYNCAKGGVTTVTRGLARVLAPHDIRVNAIAPGLVRTPMLLDPTTTPDMVEEWEAAIPLGRLGEPVDHAGATVFLASDAASYVTGATLNITGGFLMY